MMLQDLRHAWRLVRRGPAFALFATVTLGLGIGAATAVFSLVQAVLLRALPFAEADRLVWMYNARTERDRAPFSIPDLQDYQRDAVTLAGLAPFTNWTANLTGNGDAERLEGTRVAGDFFQVLGSPALIGRTVMPADASANARVAVLTHGLWTRRFAADPAIVGRTVLLNGVGHTVVGVMPLDFLFPFRDAQIAVPLPLRDDPRRIDRGANFLRVVARVKPGISIGTAKADLDRIARRLQQAYPDEDARKTGVNLYPLQAEMVSDYRQILWTLLGAVGVLVVIGCGNMANLLLVRASSRRAELALRLSLGASRGQVARQLTVEALVLAIAGSLFGLALANGGVAAWKAFGPASFPRLDVVAIDARVVLFAGVVSVAVVAICGLVPAWIVTRDPTAALLDASRGAVSSIRHGRVRRAFVIVQVAGCTVLLVCMGLVARGFARLEAVEPGFTPDHALTVQLALPPARYATRDAIARFYEALSVRLAAVPGTRAVGAVSLLPLSGLLNTMDVVFPDRPAPAPNEVPQAHFRMASRGYFAAAGIRIVEGREFGTQDDDGGQPVAVVSRTFAARHWPGGSGVGKHLKLGIAGPNPLLEIVGVVDDVKQFSLEGPATADMYIPLQQMPASQAPLVAARMNWIVRTETDPRTLDGVIRSAVREVDADVATSSMRTFDAVVAAALTSRRVNVRLLELFGYVAVVIAAVGVYAIATFSTGMRRRELAIRAACGAGRREIVRLVIRGELPALVLGILVGLAAAAACGRALVGTLFDISPWDPTTYAAVAAGVFIVAGAATYLPARHAGLANPVDILRT